jgi:hypothetical protein
MSAENDREINETRFGPNWQRAAPVLITALAGLCLILLPQAAAKSAEGYYTINFPPETLGNVGTIGPNESYTDKHGPGQVFASANGPTRVPRGADLFFTSTDKMGLENALDILKYIPSDALTSLSLKHAILSNSEVPKLIKFRRLRRLELSGTEVDDTTVKQLSALPLEALILDRTRIHGAFLVGLANNSRIKHLNIEHNDFDRDYLQELKNFPQLQWLNVSRIDLHNSDLNTIAKLTALKHLDLTGNNRITATNLASLNTLKHLNSMRIAYTGLHVRDLQKLKGLPLRHLRIDTKQAGKDDLAALAKIFPGIAVGSETNEDKSYGIYKELFQ